MLDPSLRMLSIPTLSPHMGRNDPQPKRLTAETTHQNRPNRLTPKFGRIDPGRNDPADNPRQKRPGFHETVNYLIKTGDFSLVRNYLRPSNNTRQWIFDKCCCFDRYNLLKFMKMVKYLPEFEYF